LLERAIATEEDAAAYTLLKAAGEGTLTLPWTCLNNCGREEKHRVEKREEAGQGSPPTPAEALRVSLITVREAIRKLRLAVKMCVRRDVPRGA